jgi:hypothetical protein
VAPLISLRLSLVVAAAIVGAIGLPASAAAAPLQGSSIPQPISPADGAEIPVGTIPTFVIERGPGGSNYGGRYDGTLDSYSIHISSDPTTLSDGVIQSDADVAYFMTNVVPQVTWQWTPMNRSYLGQSWWLNRPGTYYWQPYRLDCYQDTDCRVEGAIRRIIVTAPTPPPPPPPAPPPSPPPPAAPEPEFDWTIGLSLDSIPLQLAPKRSHRSFWISTRNIPDEVDMERWVAIVGVAGMRWGSRMLGATSRRPVRDRQNTVGFASLDSKVLGSTAFWYRLSSRLRCGRVSCKRIYRRHYTGEVDIRVNRFAGWEQGPGYPDELTFDLESLVLHEMGHFAGNKHVRGCPNNPMTVAIDRGEWWRSPTDWHYACARYLRAPDASPRRSTPVRHRVQWLNTGDGYAVKQVQMLAPLSLHGQPLSERGGWTTDAPTR